VDRTERQTVVFDTGQIIHGLVRAFEETDESCFLVAARRAGDWLVEIRKRMVAGVGSTWSVPML